MPLDSHELPDGRTVKLGRPEPSPENPKDLHLRRFLLPPAELPKPPEIIDNTVFVHQGFPMFANDRYGCCLVEGTQVVAPNRHAGFRVRYSGPVVTILSRGGHEITVTPNHMVLTPRGFTPARLIQQGDYVVGSRWPHEVASTFDQDFDQTPAPVEEIFAALVGIGLPRRVVRHRVPIAFDFHGDERFMYGDVDVVGADGFLQGELHAALRQPYGQREVISVSQLQRPLHRLGTTLETAHRSRTAPFRGVSCGRDSGAFLNRHPRVPNAESLWLRPRLNARLAQQSMEHLGVNPEFSVETFRCLSGLIATEDVGQISQRGIAPCRSTLCSQAHGIANRPKFKASRAQPTAEGFRTDPHLATQLCERFPGLITAEEVIEVNVGNYQGYVYDLSTDLRWYLANGIVTHNCVLASSGHRRLVQAGMVGQLLTITDEEVLRAYSAITGFKPDDPSTDNGTVMVDAVNWERRNPYCGDCVYAFARIRIDPQDRELLDLATYYLGGVWFGLNLPRSAQRQTGQVWELTGGPDDAPGSWGGHAVWSPKSRPDCREVVTWGKMQRCTHEWIAAVADESWAVLPAAWELNDPFDAIDWPALEGAIAQFGPVDPSQ